MASLLVSVRSAGEARAALVGGARFIDVKEPARGPLGMADYEVWAAVRAAVPPGTPVSVALGELAEWGGDGPDPARFLGFSFRKLGLAGSGPDWADRWWRLRRRWGGGPSWVAVAYADWERADAPPPGDVLDVAVASDDCAGVLIDTWDKSRPSPVDLTWAPWFDRARQCGRLTALAGGLDAPAIGRLAPLRPDVVAVRGAACSGGDRGAEVDPARVAALARVASAV
ncbi:MAG: (5-formylfuran-3-yl)methyl phosphate synthase [Planctomycetia bacterium]|nr:(5-formylfuran-3-yl)methyl phosphate synthase [Planctomycetia bacterium]